MLFIDGDVSYRSVAKGRPVVRGPTLYFVSFDKVDGMKIQMLVKIMWPIRLRAATQPSHGG